MFNSINIIFKPLHLQIINTDDLYRVVWVLFIPKEMGYCCP